MDKEKTVPYKRTGKTKGLFELPDDFDEHFGDMDAEIAASFERDRYATEDEIAAISGQLMERYQWVLEELAKGPETNREMKDSGVDWIKQIPESWEISTLKANFQFGKGLPITKADLLEVGIPVISYGQIHAKANTGVAVTDDLIRFVDSLFLKTNPASLTKQGDFIFADTSEDLEGCGNCVYVDKAMTLFAGYHTIILSCHESGNYKYLAYLFQTDAWRNQLRAKVTGVKLYSISRKILAGATIIQPPSIEQEHIAIYLDYQTRRIDVLIANNESQIERLKQYKQSLITETVTRGLDPDAPMKDSGVEWIGMIPADWAVFPSKYMFAEQNERRRDGDEQLTASQKYGMISQNEYMEREQSRIVMADKGLENWKHIEPNDFVISLRSFQGGLEMSGVSGCVTWHYIVLRASRNLCCSYYKWLFKSSAYITALQMTCNYIRDGQDLRYSNFVKVPLCEPPLSEQKAIAAYLDSQTLKIDALISLKQRKIEKLKQYRQSLIYECVTGKLDLRQGQQEVS